MRRNAIKLFLNPNMRPDWLSGRYWSIDFLSPECRHSARWEFNWANYHPECWELSPILSGLRLVLVSRPSWAPITRQHPGFKHSLQLNLLLTEMLNNISQSILEHIQFCNLCLSLRMLVLRRFSSAKTFKVVLQTNIYDVWSKIKSYLFLYVWFLKGFKSMIQFLSSV